MRIHDFIRSLDLVTHQIMTRWLPLEPIDHCLAVTGCKLIILDGQRADMLENRVANISAQVGNARFVVWEPQDGRGRWDGMDIWSDMINGYKGNPQAILADGVDSSPEDTAAIMFTSGT